MLEMSFYPTPESDTQSFYRISGAVLLLWKKASIIGINIVHPLRLPTGYFGGDLVVQKDLTSSTE